MAKDIVIAERLERFEEGLANAAIEGHTLSAEDRAYARELIERGLSVEERRDAMNAYFEVTPLRKRQSHGR